MSTEEGIRIGLRAAAAHLEDEAAACTKRADILGALTGTRAEAQTNRLALIAALREHANILRKQANEIRALRVRREH